MRIIIVDDEALARGVVREYLTGHEDVEIVAECANGFEAVKAIMELAPDLVFLDIQMPRLDGFEVAELTAGRTRFIFATAYDQYAIRAFEFHALDYLLKPFSQQRFDLALAHARAGMRVRTGDDEGRHEGAGGCDAVTRMAREAIARQPLERVLIRDGAKVHVIACEQIDSIEAQDDYVQIRSDGRHYLKNQSLTELEQQLPQQRFVRIHRSYIVNLERVCRIEQATRGSHVAILRDGSRIPVSRTGYQKIRAVM